jgi:hypothetical protein
MPSKRRKSDDDPSPKRSKPRKKAEPKRKSAASAAKSAKHPKRSGDGGETVDGTIAALDQLRLRFHRNIKPGIAARRAIVLEWLDTDAEKIENPGVKAICLAFADTLAVLQAPISDDEMVKEIYHLVGCNVDSRKANITGAVGQFTMGDATITARDFNTYASDIQASKITGELKDALVECRKIAEETNDEEDKQTMVQALESAAKQLEKPKEERKEPIWRTALTTINEYAKTYAPYATLAGLLGKAFGG